MRRQRRGAIGRTAALCVAATAVAVATAVPASGHSVLERSEPSADSTLPAAPEEVALWFDEPLIDDVSQATVTAPDGERASGGPVGEREIRVELEAEAEGEYLVEWQTVSPLDGHTRVGDFSFRVGPEAAADGEEDDGSAGSPTPAPDGTSDVGGSSGRDVGDHLVAVARTIEYLGLLTLLGWLTLGALARGGELAWVPTRVLPWVVLAMAGGALTVTGELLQAGRGATVVAAEALLATSAGLARVGRLAVEMVLVVVGLLSARRTGDGVPTRRGRVGLAWLALAALGLLSGSGHAAGGGGYAVAAQAGHLIAAGVWAGTLIAMAVHRPPDGWRGEIGRRLVEEFTPIALTMFVATVLLGSLRSVQELTRLSDFVTTSYGQVLLIKVLLVCLMVPLSYVAWQRIRHLPRAEGTLAVTVLVLAALLAASPLPRSGVVDQPDAVGDGEGTEDRAGTSTEGRPQADDLTLGGEAGTTVVGLTLRPGEPGDNDVYASLVPVGGEDDADGLKTSLTVADDDPVPMEPCGAACRTTTVALNGGEDVEVTLDNDGERVTANFSLPDLPAPDGTELLRAAENRMNQLETLRYDEVFGPSDPPTTSTWEIVAPDRLHGVIITGQDGEHRETLRIDDRRWRREGVDGDWEGGEAGELRVTANRFIWEQDDRVAVRVVGDGTVDGVSTRQVSFFLGEHRLAIWFRLWIDDDHLVRRAEMRARGHFMDHRYYDFDEDIDIRPPP